MSDCLNSDFGGSVFGASLQCSISTYYSQPSSSQVKFINFSDFFQVFDALSNALMKTAEQGGDTLVHAAISSEVEGRGGLYLENFYPARNSSFTSDLSNQNKLFQLTCRLLKIETFGRP